MATIKYEEALREIEEIVSRLENDEMDIDSLSTELKKAQKLIKQCKDVLEKTEQDVKSILDNNQ
jgi:exodeoxyribonuclease VII small subunit